MSAFRRLFTLMALAAVVMITPARAAPIIDITRGNLDPMPVAAPDFLVSSNAQAEIARDVTRVIRADLERSGLFRPIDQGAYIEKFTTVYAKPSFADWKIINAKALVIGRVEALPNGVLRGGFRLWDITDEELIYEREFELQRDSWRRLAHMIADEIYEQLTGEKGYFDTRIVFVSESGPKTNRVKRLTIMDQDGASPSFLTDGSYMVLTPRFSPTAQTITYMSYQSGRPRIYLFDLDKNRQEVLGEFSSTFAPRFTPDGLSVLLTREAGGNSEIYKMNLQTRQMVRLTTHPAIDTSASASPDGSQIVFNSDRSGSPQLYVMAGSGGEPRRISFGDGRYLTPVWSPRGDLIAFTKQVGGRFQIGVMRTDGSGERILSESYLDEGPTWSPNGRVIMFFREPGPGQGPSLWSVDLTGQNLRRIQTPGDASDPAWSPARS